MSKRSIAAAVVACSALGVAVVPAFAATKSVKVGDDYFVKSSGVPKITVSKGTTVKWQWRGTAPHNVTVSKGPAKFSSKIQSSGSFSKKVSKAGTYTILCTLHEPGMKMTLVVR